MKIVFVTPAAGLRRNPVYRLGGTAYGQMNSITGPLILGGILKKAGHDVEVYEELNARVDIKSLMKDADIFCFSIMTSNAPRAYRLADMVHDGSGARVIMGGIHASAMPDEALEHADQVITGEGESVILRAVEDPDMGPVIEGPVIEDLDTVPFPDYSILKTPCRAANVMSTRGCPYRCTFCTTSRHFAPYRQRSVDDVIEEIRVYKALGFEYINFEDDNFTADRERAKEICRRMIDEGLVFKETFFFGRTDLAEDEELLELLSRAHLTRVLIGIESLNQDSLDTVNKGQSVSDIRRAAIACRDHHIRLIASIVLGIDDDGREDIRRGVDFAKEIDAYQLQPAILTPFPGTPVYEEYENSGRMITRDWSVFDMMNVTFSPAKMTAWQLQKEFCRALRKFYDFRSVRTISRIFGKEYGARRFALAVFTRLGSLGICLASRIKVTHYNFIHSLG